MIFYHDEALSVIKNNHKIKNIEGILPFSLALAHGRAFLPGAGCDIKRCIADKPQANMTLPHPSHACEKKHPRHSARWLAILLACHPAAWAEQAQNLPTPDQHPLPVLKSDVYRDAHTALPPPLVVRKSAARQPYDVRRLPSEGMTAVATKGRWGFVDHQGKEIVAPQYDNVWSFREGLAAVQQNGLWGYIDSSGRPVIPPRYDNALSFGEGRAAIQKNGRWGFIDPHGREVITPRYDKVWPFHNGIAIVMKNGQYQYIDRNGQYPTDFTPKTPKK